MLDVDKNGRFGPSLSTSSTSVTNALDHQVFFTWNCGCHKEILFSLSSVNIGKTRIPGNKVAKTKCSGTEFE